jgi:hypothetical protein
MLPQKKRKRAGRFLFYIMLQAYQAAHIGTDAIKFS